MMDWHREALELSKQGLNSGEITRQLKSIGFFQGEDFSPCYERVRKYVRKHSGGKNHVTQNVIPNTFDHTSEEKVIKFGLISDTHLGSNYDEPELLHEFYNECKKQGIKSVYHCGDITDGDAMRVGHEYEIYAHGADAIIDNVVEKYPVVYGIETYFITGNHDASIYKHCGVDIGKHIDERRSDLHYLGRDCARINLDSAVTLELRHPWDGSAYAISQKSQKIIDNMWENRPTIIGIGHYHKAEFIYYKGVYAFQCGCFQHQTPFEVGKNILPVVGGWIIEITLNKNGDIKSISPKFINFN